MNMILIWSSMILIIVAGIITWFAVKQENKKIQDHKNESAEEARERSLAYEKNSVSKMLPVQIWTYSIVTIVTIIVVIIFAFNY
ncbi:MAG TPA: hypothetical protein VK078_05830 [Pseudogracilibacillus sp.]|nr:hypothetical protein [Pseudogracilibacillus sp.]